MAQWYPADIGGSQGLNRWGHFTSSKRSMELHEPIYLNLWTAQIDASDLPNGMINVNGNTTSMNAAYDNDKINIVLEGLRSVSGLDTQPGVGQVSQKYKWAERGYAGGQPNKTHLDLVMNFELNINRDDTTGTNDNYTYKFLRRWSDLTYDPLTGKMNIKKNYVARAMTILLHDKDGIPIHPWICYNFFPTSAVPAPPLSYDNGNIWQNFQMTFWCDYFDEAIL